MKLLLVSFNQQDVEECKRAPTDISSLGLRYLSSYLKKKGHKVNLLFLPKPYGREETQNELKQINGLISSLKPDLIGLSLMSTHFFRAKKATISIKKVFDIPIIWGGLHPTIEPVDSLAYADLVCVGEGELATEKLLEKAIPKNGEDFDIPGIWYKKNGQTVNKEKAPLLGDIDSAPFPDYDLEDQYIVHDGKLVPLDIEIFRQYYPASRGDHRIISSRGCPHACSYCCNSTFRSLYQGRHFRKRTVEGVISEMSEIKNKFSFIRFFKINDDTFFANSIDWLREFARQYKEKINLPFFCLTSPLTLDREKLETLVNAGLTTVQMGLQTGSDRLNKEIYLRNISSDDFLKAMRLLESYPKIKVLLDAISDNPYETQEDLLKSIEVLNQLKRGFNLGLYSLVFYPGTELYRRATKDNKLKNFEEYLSKEYHIFKPTYLNKVTYLIPYMEAAKIKEFVDKRNNPLVRIRLDLLFFIYMKKNKIPLWLLIFLSKIKKMLKK